MHTVLHSNQEQLTRCCLVMFLNLKRIASRIIPSAGGVAHGGLSHIVRGRSHFVLLSNMAINNFYTHSIKVSMHFEENRIALEG